MLEITPPMSGSVSIHLLDGNVGGVVKTWKFTEQSKITIGRSDDRDVEINDAYVSREHATIYFENNQWMLKSLGRNGVVVNNQPVTEIALTANVTFRLGSSGPIVRFCLDDTENPNMRTLTFDDTLPFYQLDETKLQEEVAQITEGDYFQSLQKKAQQLREKH